MIRALRLVWVSAALVLLVSSAYCADVYPTVAFNFDPANFEYAWTVNYTTDVTAYFSTFLVYTSIPNGSWTSVSGPVSGAQDEGWVFTAPPNDDGTVALRWSAGANQTRTPAGGAWAGTFKIVVPNSQPMGGYVCTYGSALRQLDQQSKVPSPVPEPSSVLALGTLVGLVPLVLRKRRS